ncbi:MAG: Fic family protein [Bdellovibrionales bacterium]|nr:Fic family protein [Bdellovibrionales bacterium]
MRTLSQLKQSLYQVPTQKQRLMHDLAESKGRQAMFINQSPEILERLMHYAIIESVRASTSMEGVVVPETRQLDEMVRDAKWKPKNRDEQDVLAYRNALNYVFEEGTRLKLSTETILSLSKILWAHDPELARLKSEDNEIALVYPDGTKVSRFKPPSASETPELLERSCVLYNDLIENSEYVDHLVISAFILDLLCIHPLADGNGRLARLLHVMLLVKADYQAIRFVSHEGLIERDKEEYYDALYQSSKGWNEGQHKPNAWMNFSLGKLYLAFKRFESQVTEAQKTFADSIRRSESSQVAQMLEAITPGQSFDRNYIETKSKVSGRTTRRVIGDWITQGRLLKVGAGRGVRYKKLR